MTKEEASDFIALHYPTYIDKLVYFSSVDITARIKSIEAIEGEGGEFIPTCFLENPNEEDTSFKNHLFSHMPLEDVISLGRIV